MPLKKNQIRQLLVWVHPGHVPVRENTLEEWKSVIEILEHEPRVALIETTMVGTLDMPKDACRMPYGDYYEIFRDKPDAQKHMIKVGELELLAKEKLGDRYHVWPCGNFIDANDKNNLDKLEDLLNVEARAIFPDCFDAYFFEIYCYGLIPEICVEWQRYDFGLSKICYDVKGQKLYPGESIKNFRFMKIDDEHIYLEGIPSTQESLSILKEKGYMNPYSANERILERYVPSSSSDEAKGIICVPTSEF
ncbi:MAG: hypothetical protein KAS90_05280 [Candidatus Aenigmarchaeota archaeon]|nr:hypothetical protein [Candidatus Aenigmarchaeota archaeon]